MLAEFTGTHSTIRGERGRHVALSAGDICSIEVVGYSAAERLIMLSIRTQDGATGTCPYSSLEAVCSNWRPLRKAGGASPAC